MRVCCPICKKRITPSSDDAPNPYHPFCSELCRWIDLGRWLDGTYHLETPDRSQTYPEHPSKSLDST